VAKTERDRKRDEVAKTRKPPRPINQKTEYLKSLGLNNEQVYEAMTLSGSEEGWKRVLEYCNAIKAAEEIDVDGFNMAALFGYYPER